MKSRTDLRAGECPGQWSYGLVQESSGGGFYGSVLGEDGQKRFFNYGYTEFCPSGEGVSIGEWVSFSLFEHPNPRAGKIACMSKAPTL